MTSAEFVEDEEPPDEVVDDESEIDDRTLVETGPSSLPYFGADFDVSGLVRRLNEKDIVIPRFDPDESGGTTLEGFQRQRVWTTSRMERFIESLLLGWPVPSIFLVLEPDQRYLVLDGQQRLTTLQAFYSGKYPDGKDFILKDVAPHLQDATYATLSNESRRRLNNTFIQAVIIEPAGDAGRDAVYRLFGRLNSGGVQLTAQEIRVALYRGPLVNFIRELNHDRSWRDLFGSTHKKLKDHELILRALAMRDVLAKVADQWTDDRRRIEAYRPPMAQFLNSYLEHHNDLKTLDTAALQNAFSTACATIVEAVGRDGLKYAGRLNAAHVDALLGSMLYLLTHGSNLSRDVVEEAIKSLRSDRQYFHFVSTSTSHRDSVYGRLQLAYRALTSE